MPPPLNDKIGVIAIQFTHVWRAYQMATRNFLSGAVLGSFAIDDGDGKG